MYTLMNWMWERKAKGKNSWMKEQVLYEQGKTS